MNNSNDSKLQVEYNDLRKRYIKVLTDNQYLRYQVKELTELSRSRLAKLIESGHVKLNDQVCKSKKVLVNSGDRLSITVPAPEPQNLKPEAIPLDIGSRP